MFVFKLGVLLGTSIVQQKITVQNDVPDRGNVNFMPLITEEGVGLFLDSSNYLNIYNFNGLDNNIN